MMYLKICEFFLLCMMYFLLMRLLICILIIFVFGRKFCWSWFTISMTSSLYVNVLRVFIICMMVVLMVWWWFCMMFLIVVFFLLGGGNVILMCCEWLVNFLLNEKTFSGFIVLFSGDLFRILYLVYESE